MIDSAEEDNFIIKIIDWGLSSFIQPNQKLTEDYGTLEFMAPEVLKKSYNEKCDIWSCGIIFFEMLSGKTPFYSKDVNENSEKDIEERIRLGVWDFDENEWKDISEEAKELIT